MIDIVDAPPLAQEISTRIGLEATDLAILRSGRLCQPAEIATRSHAALLRMEIQQAKLIEQNAKIIELLAQIAAKPAQAQQPPALPRK